MCWSLEEKETRTTVITRIRKTFHGNEVRFTITHHQLTMIVYNANYLHRNDYEDEPNDEEMDKGINTHSILCRLLPSVKFFISGMILLQLFLQRFG